MEIKKVLNYTNGTITFRPEKDTTMVLHSNGVAKCDITRDTVSFAPIQGGKKVVVNKVTCHNVSGLPKREHGTAIIVSNLVYQCIGHLRDDIYVVDAPVKADGRTIGYKSISRPVYEE